MRFASYRVEVPVDPSTFFATNDKMPAVQKLIRNLTQQQLFPHLTQLLIDLQKSRKKKLSSKKAESCRRNSCDSLCARAINEILLLPYGVINFYYTSLHHLIDD